MPNKRANELRIEKDESFLNGSHSNALSYFCIAYQKIYLLLLKSKFGYYNLWLGKSFNYNFTRGLSLENRIVCMCDI